MKQLTLTVLLLMGVFGLRAQSLQLTSPNGGEVWLGGSVHNITWTFSNVDNIKIEYSLNNGLNWTIITPSYPTSALSYTWTVPCIGSNQAKIRITSTLQFTQDESNNVFTIPEPTVDITYPDGGESFGTGTGQYIEWATTGVTTLKVQYTMNNGTSWTDIGNFPAANRYCNWIPPAGISSQARIRAFNIESTRNRDSSATLFNIEGMPTLNADKYKGGPLDGYNMCPSLPDTIKVLTPNGGEVYSPTNTVTLNWSFRHIDQIKIEYSTNNGSSWNSIVNDIPASQLSYVWTIPNTPSNQCRVKITSLRTGFSDISDAPFTINAAFVNVLYPNGGESFGTGTGQYIEWDFNSVSTVKLEYSTNNGSTWTTIGTAPATNRYANWIPPATVTSACLIRISDNALPNVSDVSSGAFSLFNLPALDANKYKGGINDGYSMNSTLPDTIRLTSPNGGELWTAASTRTITWTYNEVDNVAIELTLDDGVTWTTLAASVPASQLSYTWTVPTTPSFTCRIRVRDLVRPIQDVSDAVFIIPTSYVQITYPNGGESFGATTGQYIEWDYNDLATIRLEYSINNGISWILIGNAPAANRYANWVVPATPSSQILIRATDIANPIYTDNSNAVFSSFNLPTLDVNKYKGGQFDGYSMYAFKDVYVKVINPNGGEIWGNGTTQQIRWATLNTNENLKVEYSIDNEATWTTLLNNVPNSPVTFNWNIASPVSTICKVRATTMSGMEFDKSDDFFTIANPNGIITNPIAGNIFCSGESTTVTFNRSVDFNPGNKFIVQLSDSVGTFNGSLINIGEITATEPAPITVALPPRFYSSNLYRLRVIGTNPPTLGTDNGANFTINPLPAVRLGRDTSICAGSTITLNATSSGSSYQWSTGASTPSIQVSQAGQYWVAATNSCGTTRDTINVNIIQPPAVNLGPDRQICLNSSTVLVADSGAYAYQWSTGAVSRTINAVLPGTYAVSVTNACGIANDEITISTIPSATVNLGQDRGLCSGESVVLNAGNQGATFVWSTGSNAQTINVTSPGTYSVNVTTGCGTVSDQITLFNGAFQVNAGLDRTICSGESIQLTATGGNAYNWNTGQTTSSITVSPATTTSYTVSATNIYNCTSTDVVVVNVNALPTATSTLIGTATYCTNQPSVLQANSGSGLSYQWLLNNVNVSGATSASYSPNTSGSYSVRVTNAQNCRSTSNPQAITVLSAPEASITPSGNVGLCSGNSVTLQANTGDGLQYNWNRDGSELSTANGSFLLVTQGGSYIVKVTSANGCFANSEATLITVNETPTVNITSNGSTNLCNGGSTVLTANAPSGTSFQWEKDGVSIPNETSANLTVSTAGIYSVTGLSLAGCPATSNGLVINSSVGAGSRTVISACNSFLWSRNGVSYQSSGVYVFAQGCSSDTLELIISNSSAAEVTIAACGSYTWNGTTYTQSGNYIWTGANAAGCDSVVTLNLIVTPQPERPQIACWQTATFDTILCSWNITGTQPQAPTTACYESATFNTATCSWDVTGTQPEAPATACYESATFNTATCSWDVTGSQPEAPATACYESASFNTTTCSWDVTGTQPEAPSTACYESASFNTATCSWDVTGTQPEAPATACYESASFNTTTCTWDVNGTQPEAPATACYESATFNTTTCSWDVTGTQPEAPATACYESATFNTTTCTWDVTGTQPEAPATACYESATFNTATCSWDVTGSQPEAPATACYESATFNTATCSWDVTGSQPEAPATACYESASFNTTTCSWDVTGTQPEAPATACYESASFNTATCSWDVTGTQPEAPATACYESASFNTATCSWDVTGTQPEAPATACYESATFNTTTCSWDVTGTQPAPPTGLACWQSANFNTATCSWDVSGTQPAQPTGLACWQSANFNTTTCSWDVTGTQPTQPTGLACWQSANFNTTTCSWDVTGTQPTQPTNLACYQTATFNTVTCGWDVTGTQPAQPTNLACYQTATFNTASCSWVVSGTPAPAIVTNASTCGTYTWAVNNQQYTASGTYNFSANCQDYTLVLNITPITNSTTPITACGSYTWPVNGQTYTQSGTYTFLDGCVNRTLQLTISGATTAGQISGPANSCAHQGTSGTNATYSLQATNASSYVWTIPSGATNVSGLGTASISFRYPSTFSSGTVSVVVSGCGAPITRSISVTRTAPATPGAITGPVNVCAFRGTNTPVTYSIAAVANASSYTWTLPTGVTLVSGSGTTSIQVLIGSAFCGGNITVRANSSCGNSSTRNLALSVSTPATPGSISGPTTACPGNSQTYSVAAVSNATSYQWTVPSGTTITAGSGTNSITLSFGSAFCGGTLTVRAVNGCGQSSTRSLSIIRNTPATPGTISGPVNNLCGGGTRTYSIAAVSGATSYNWTVPAGASIVTNNGTSISVNFSNTFTSGNITVAAVNACGAGTARSISVSRLPATPASISGPSTVCRNQAGVVYSTPVVSGVTYTWTVPSGAVITAGQGTASVTVKFGNTSGNVTVKANNSCGSSSTRSLAVCVASCRFGETEPEELTTKPNLEYGFAIYPNPGFGSVNISLPELNEEIQLRVYASNGTLIRSEQIPAGNHSWGLLLDNESDGLYLIQIETTSQLKQLRYIKQ